MRSILDPYVKVDVKTAKTDHVERQSKRIINNGKRPPGGRQARRQAGSMYNMHCGVTRNQLHLCTPLY